MANNVFVEEVEDDDFKIIVLDQGNEMYTISNVRSIKIKDKDYNLLIMRDYLPVIGQIEGSISIEAATSMNFENVKAFYSLSHNVFNLIIKEKNS